MVSTVSKSAFDHLCLSLNARKPDNLFGMFTCYFDEAGGSDHGFIAVSGWVASVERWQRFESDWKQMLTAHGVPYLHMKECAHFNGPYGKWEFGESRRGRDSFIKDACAIIQETAEFGVVCVVHYEDFRKVNERFRLKEHLRSPYALAGRFCIARSNEWVKKQGRSLRDIADYVFEDGGPDMPGLVDVTKRASLQIPSFKPSRGTETQLGMVQLQAADLLVYEVRKAVVDHRDPMTKPEMFRKSFQAFFGCDVEQGNYREEQLLDLCEGAKIPARMA